MEAEILESLALLKRGVMAPMSVALEGYKLFKGRQAGGGRGCGPLCQRPTGVHAAPLGNRQRGGRECLGED